MTAGFYAICLNCPVAGRTVRWRVCDYRDLLERGYAGKAPCPQCGQTQWVYSALWPQARWDALEEVAA